MQWGVLTSTSVNMRIVGCAPRTISWKKRKRELKVSDLEPAVLTAEADTKCQWRQKKKKKKRSSDAAAVIKQKSRHVSHYICASYPIAIFTFILYIIK